MLETQWTIDKVREMFIDPTGENDAAKLCLQAGYLVAALNETYTNKNPKALASHISSLGNDEIGQVLQDMAHREADTRKFDHKFMGQIHPQGNKVGILAKLAGGFMNTNTIVKEVSPSEHTMEHESLDWLAKMVGYDPETFSGNLVSGGSTANLAGLWAARESIIKEKKESGSYKRGEDMVIITSRMKHYSIQKASTLLGDNVFCSQPRTEGYKSDLDEMEKIIKICQKKGKAIIALVGLAGETETGMVDDLDQLADLAEHYGIHYHVDAAYGGPYKMVRPELFEGIERADSITIDPHKALYTPYASGAILFKDKKVHARIENKARYLQRDNNRGVRGPRNERNFGLSGRVEGSMGPDAALMTWASIKLFGEEGYKVILKHTLDLTQTALNRVQDSKIIQPLHEPETNTLLVGLKTNSYTRVEKNKIIEEVAESLDKQGYYISVNDEVDHGNAAFRTVYTHPWTSECDVLDMLDKLEGEVKKKTS
jgi:aromatic-L-amino-acid/L-tryptophan decarboxylase